MEKQFIYNDIIVNYRTEGEGKVVVLIHGFPEDNHIWDKQVEFLKPHYRLIIPDLPGSGKSEMLTASATITINDYAEIVHAILMQENTLHCIMCGHSMGGYITLAFAEKYPKLLQAFGLIHSTAFADSEEKKQNRKKSIDLIGNYGSAAFLKTMVPSMFSKAFKSAHADKIKSLTVAGNKFKPQTLQQYYTAMMNRPDRTAVLKSSVVPVLFIIGEEDTAAPAKDVLQQVHLPDTAWFHVLDNVAHMSMWESTERLNEYLLKFIEAV